MKPPKPGADTLAVARADATSTTDSDTAAAGRANVVVREADRLRGINRGGLIHLLRRGVRHRDFRHVEIVHLAAAASAATGLEVDHDQFAAALFMDGDNQEQQQTDVEKDREREGTRDQPEVVPPGLQPLSIGLVIVASKFRSGLFTAHHAVQHRGDDHGRDDQNYNAY